MDDLAVIIKNEFEKVDERFEKVDKKINNLPDKSYLDRKIGDLRGDVITIIRKEDTKLKKLITTLRKKDFITIKELETLSKMEPFPDVKLHLKF